MSNFFVQELVLYRHFMLIDSPIPFDLIANPTNYRKDEHGFVLNQDMSKITGRDVCRRPAGAWRINCWTLLPEQYHKQNPVFTMLIKYDRDLLKEGEIVDIRYSDIDLGEGVAGVNGQLVSIPADDFRPVVNSIESASASLADKFDEQNIFLSEINASIGSISDDVSTLKSGVESLVSRGSEVFTFTDLKTLLSIPSGFYEGGMITVAGGPIRISGRFLIFGDGSIRSISASVCKNADPVYSAYLHGRGSSLEVFWNGDRESFNTITEGFLSRVF